MFDMYTDLPEASFWGDVYSICLLFFVVYLTARICWRFRNDVGEPPMDSSWPPEDTQ